MGSGASLAPPGNRQTDQADRESGNEPTLRPLAGPISIKLHTNVPDARQQKEFGELIKQLGADEFSSRTGASAALAEKLPPAAGLLVQAMKSDDPEIRARAYNLLLNTPLELKGTALPSTFLRKLAETTGVPIKIELDDRIAAPITLNLTSTTLLGAVEKLCKESGAVYRNDGQALAVAEFNLDDIAGFAAKAIFNILGNRIINQQPLNPPQVPNNPGDPAEKNAK